MATNNVSTFLQTINQGIKPNMFSVDISFPTDGAGDADNPQADDRDLTNILCKSAALPGSNLVLSKFLSEEEPSRSQVIEPLILGLQLSLMIET